MWLDAAIILVEVRNVSFGQMRQNSSSLAKDIGYVCRKKGDVYNPKNTVLTLNYGDAAASMEVGISSWSMKS